MKILASFLVLVSASDNVFNQHLNLGTETSITTLNFLTFQFTLHY